MCDDRRILFPEKGGPLLVLDGLDFFPPSGALLDSSACMAAVSGSTGQNFERRRINLARREVVADAEHGNVHNPFQLDVHEHRFVRS